MNKGSFSGDRCPVCSSSDYYLDSRASQIFGLQSPYKVLTCSRCGLKRLDPQLSNMELENIYSQGYFDSTNADKTVIENLELPGNYEDAVKSRYVKFHQTLVNLKDKFPQAKGFLDVGAATGDMVAIARDSGLDADGIEFSDFAVKQAKDKFGLDLKQCSLAAIEAESYDLIHLNHVFEHFNDPVSELAHLQRILRSGGGMYIEIPYQLHVIERLKHRLKPKKVPFSLHSIHHPFFYTPRTIKRILRDNGFQIMKFSVFAANRYPSSKFSHKIKLVFWWLLSCAQIGNYIEVIAVKHESKLDAE